MLDECYPPSPNCTSARTLDSVPVEDFYAAEDSLPPDAPFDQIFVAALARVQRRTATDRAAHDNRESPDDA
jgi:hypothetical protein